MQRRAKRGYRSRLCWLTILLVAAVFRLWMLDIKPAHFDEGVNGWFVDQMAKNGYFAYDPTNYHGPLHFYILYASQTLLGRNLWALRLPTVVAGVLTILALRALRRFLPERACLWAGMFVAVSPAFTFYSRYAIHESWQTLFLLTATYGVLGVMARNASKDIWVLLMSVAGLVLTKETFIVHAVVAATAMASLSVYERWVPSWDSAGKILSPGQLFGSRLWGWRNACAAGAASAGLIVFFYSGTFFHWEGVAGLWQSFAAWTATGTDGQGHEKPFFYWLGLLVRFEWPSLLGLAAVAMAAFPWARAPRLVNVYAFGILLAYSIIPYKTPWCILAILPHLLLMVGLALDRLAGQSRNCTIVAALLGSAAGLHSLVAAWRVNFREFTNDAHPYVYVQTYEDIRRLTDPLLDLARKDPAIRHLPGEIHLESYYPLPWILGDFSRVAYRQADSTDGLSQADWVVVEKDRAAAIEPLLGFDAFVEDFRLRSGQSWCRVYFRAKTFQEAFIGRTPEFRADGAEASAQSAKAFSSK